MSPILTRPVREQLEHDRVIRELQGRYKRKNEVIINPGNELNQSVTVGDLVVYPDLLLLAEGGKKLLGTIEVETGESVNALEARAEWAVFCKLKVPLHLYVPPTSVDTARRLCAEYSIPVAEIWTFHITYDQVRFTMIHRSPDAPIIKVSNAPSKPTVKPIIKPTPKPDAKPDVKPAVVVAAKAVAKPAAKPAVPVAKAVTKLPVRQGSAAKAAKAKAKAAPKAAAKVKAKPVVRAKGPATKAKTKAKPAKAKPAAKKRR